MSLKRNIHRFVKSKFKLGVLHPVQQAGSYKDVSSILPLVGFESTEVPGYGNTPNLSLFKINSQVLVLYTIISSLFNVM